LNIAGDFSDEVAVRGALQGMLQEHPSLDSCDLYVAGPGVLAKAAESLLLARGLPRSQLTLNALET